MEKLIHIYAEAAGNTFLQLVLIAVVIDTIFGVLRAIKERRSLWKTAVRRITSLHHRGSVGREIEFRIPCTSFSFFVMQPTPHYASYEALR